LIGWPLKKPIKIPNANDTDVNALLAQAEYIFNNVDEFIVEEEALLAA
jgi:hypothetical protein